MPEVCSSKVCRNWDDASRWSWSWSQIIVEFIQPRQLKRQGILFATQRSRRETRNENWDFLRLLDYLIWDDTLKLLVVFHSFPIFFVLRNTALMVVIMREDDIYSTSRYNKYIFQYSSKLNSRESNMTRMTNIGIN